MNKQTVDEAARSHNGDHLWTASWENYEMKALCCICLMTCSLLTEAVVNAESWVLPKEGTELKLNVGRVPSKEMRAVIQSERVRDKSLFDLLPRIGRSDLDIEGEPRVGFNKEVRSTKEMAYIEWASIDHTLKDDKTLNTLKDSIPDCVSEVGKKVTSRGQAWEIAYRCLKSLAEGAEGKSALDTFIDNGASLYVVEPVLDLDNQGFIEKRTNSLDDSSNEDKPKYGLSEFTAADPCPLHPSKTKHIAASPVWPSGDPGWHLGSEYTQLKDAYKTVFQKEKDEPGDVVVAHLDTGYFDCDPMRPRFFNNDSFNNGVSYSCDATGCIGAVGAGRANGSLKWPYFPNSPWHGTATLSNLAGREYLYPADSNPQIMGGNPRAKGFSIRIHDSYIHLDSRAMGLGIEKAVENKADVITISAGGIPSARLAAAVNHAYLNGTVIIAATGDFVTLPFDIGRTPRQVVYPARYSRVMGVTGVTKDNKSYGDSPSIFWWLRFGKGYFSNIGSWMLRGSYGPSSVMSLNVIAAYAPNITRSLAEKGKNNVIGSDGPGTSHAAPQVAAAASLWIQDNYAALEQITGLGMKWQKSEAVYRALSASAHRCFPDYTIERYGNGIIRAHDALAWKYAGDGTIVKTDKEGAVLTAPVRLQLRAEADLDLPGVFEAFLSAKLPIPNKDSVIRAFAYALVTELTQLALTSETLQEYLQNFHICKPQNGCEICTREQFDPARLLSFLQGIESIVRGLPEASPTLKDALRERSLANGVN